MLEQEQSQKRNEEQLYELEETKKLVALVKEASELLRTKGETALHEFAIPGSKWRQDESYIFVLDDRGHMLVHIDPELTNKNVLDLKDINGKPIIRGLINAATSIPNKPEGWYHYQWPVPGGLFPRWKSSYVHLVTTPSGKNYIVGSGMYNDRMEKAFAKDAVEAAVAEIEKHGRAAFKLFHDPKGPFLAKDEYVFVYTLDGVALVVPGFQNLEGQNLANLQDSTGKFHMREMLNIAKKGGNGWVDYTLPKPGENISIKKIAYVSRAKLEGQWVLVGCGIYLEDTPRKQTTKTLTAKEVMVLVNEAATLLAKEGEKAFPELQKKGSKWFNDLTYFFVYSPEGKRVFHAAEPHSVDQNDTELKDVIGRPIGKMILDAVKNSAEQGWAHYMYTEPGKIFPIWKSTFLKLVTFPSGESYIVGTGAYKMKMDEVMIEDVVNRAVDLISHKGQESFKFLRDKKGAFVFMDTYVFVDNLEGVELVNPGFPSLEGKKIIDLKDVKGKKVVKEYISTAVKNESDWVEYYWYRPGDNTIAKKRTFVRKVLSGQNTYIVGAGFYTTE